MGCSEPLDGQGRRDEEDPGWAAARRKDRPSRTREIGREDQYGGRSFNRQIHPFTGRDSRDSTSEVDPTMSGEKLVRGIGRVLGAIFGAMLGYVGGTEEGTLFLGLVYASLGLSLGALVGPYVAYLVAGVLAVVFVALSAVGVVLYVVAMAVVDPFRRLGRAKRDQPGDLQE